MTARQIHRFLAIARQWGNSCHIIVPRAWNNKRVYCLVKEEYDVIRDQMRNLKVEIIESDGDEQQKKK